jgi:hypothetical protein
LICQTVPFEQSAANRLRVTGFGFSHGNAANFLRESDSNNERKGSIMAVSSTFLPVKLADILNYATQVYGLISGKGFTSAKVG